MPSYDDCLRDAARAHGVRCGDVVEPFAQLPYDVELALKREAVTAFLRGSKLSSGATDELVAAPVPRGWRTTSRRRTGSARGGTRLFHGDGGALRGDSPLEPALHAAVYATVERLLGALPAHVGRAVNHVILRGTYDELALILNVRALDAQIVRSLRRLAERVGEAHREVRHAWLYHDPRGSRYYLELERPASGVGAKKLFGAAAWRQRIGDVTHQVGVFSFSQVNLAMVPLLVDAVRRHADPRPDDTLFDLHCGYGLFGASMARLVRRVIAVDADEPTVDNARHAIGRAGGQVLALRQALRGAQDVARVAQASQRSAGRGAGGGAIAILDPPRAGTPAGLIAGVAEHLRPRRVVQVFCGPDEIGRSVTEWKACGYVPERITPLDLFPGTAGLEVVVALVPAARAAAARRRTAR